jgi:peptide-methionine (S)-S-oxide reductase
MNPAPLRTALSAALALAVATACAPGQASSKSFALPDPKVDAAKPRVPGKAVAVFAGGCFWGVEAVFEHLKGVGQVTSGYSGGTTPPPVDYDDVTTGRTGYAEAVRVEYDPSKISYGQLLKVFFSVAHDPTQLNRQGPDVGTQYRSAIFYGNAEQQKVARAYIAQLDAAKVYPKKIVTQVAPLEKFYQAEEYHQDYMRRNPNQPYIVYHDKPKIANLKKQFPQLLKGGS